MNDDCTWHTSKGPSDTDRQEMARLKAYFPYRIVYCAVRGNERTCSAVATMRIPNRLARDGWQVWTMH